METGAHLPTVTQTGLPIYILVAFRNLKRKGRKNRECVVGESNVGRLIEDIYHCTNDAHNGLGKFAENS